MPRPLAAFAAVWIAAAFGVSGCGKKAAPSKYAALKTSKGTITVRLFADAAPNTVQNFIDLAAGKKPWKDPRDGRMKTAPLYNGVVFHRVIPGFMVQTGDPLGNGEGEIGFEIPDEIRPELRYDRPGLVGMANHGPNTGASQFFITAGPAPDLNGRHTMFGEVVDGLKTVKAISEVPRNVEFEANRPLEPVVLESVTITDKPPRTP